MPWFEKLKKLVDVKIDFRNLINIHITKNSGNPSQQYHFDETKKTLEIYLDPLSKDKKDDLKATTQEAVKEGHKLLEKDTSKLLSQLYKYKKENSNEGILTFFKPIIPLRDYEALEASLYLRDVFKKGGDVKKLKADIRKRFYGDRGNNIANLCTAGYFENFLMPLYNESKERFNDLYEIIIEKSVLAVFVYGEMEQEGIKAEISQKLNISKKYGIKFIHIHGIGITNVAKIKECVEQNKEFFKVFDKNLFEKENIIILELLFK